MKRECLRPGVFRHPESRSLWISYYVRGANGRAHQRCESVAKALGLRPEQVRLKHALKLRRARLADHDAGRLQPELSELTVSQILDAYLRRHTLRRGGEPPLRQTLSVVASIRRDLGPVKFPELTTPRLEAWAGGLLASGLKTGTVHLRVARLAAALRCACDDRTIRLPRMPQVAPSPPRQRFYTSAEFDQVVAGMEPVYGDIFRFARLSGWRKGEILGLRWIQVDRAGGVVSLEKSKTGPGRALPLLGELADVIECRWRERALGVPHVFHRRGRRVTADMIDRARRAACAELGLDRNFHDLRRTMAVEYRRAGVPDKAAMATAGWRTREVYDRNYSIIVDPDVHAAVERRMRHDDSTRTAAQHSSTGTGS